MRRRGKAVEVQRYRTRTLALLKLRFLSCKCRAELEVELGSIQATDMASLQQLKVVGEEEEGGTGGDHAADQLARGAGSGRSGSGAPGRKVTYGFHLAEGRLPHGMEDRHVAELRRLRGGGDVGLFAVFDGHSGAGVASYLRDHLLDSVLAEPGFWTDDAAAAIRRAYRRTDREVLGTMEDSKESGEGNGGPRRGGSTAVTAVLINGETLAVANVGDSRAVLCDGRGRARQLSVDHEPLRERRAIESRGGFVTEIHGDVPRVDAQLAMARAFGDPSLKDHISAEPDVAIEEVGGDGGAELLVLASDGGEEDGGARAAAARLVGEAVRRGSKDDIACIVVRLH